MPTPNDILDKMHGDNYFSFLDGASAYWAVEMEEGDRQKTAFSTPRGHYEMVRMPFGLCNSQATYQRLMDSTLEGIEAADPNVDDTCVHSPDFENHMRDLRAPSRHIDNQEFSCGGTSFGSAIRKENLWVTLSPQKDAVPFHRLLRGYVRQRDPRLRFLGMVIYNREPLYRLTSKGKTGNGTMMRRKLFEN